MRISLGRVVLMQWTTAAVLFGLLVFWGLVFDKGYTTALSFLLGAGCSLVPNSLFALHLWAHARVNKARRRVPSPVFFFVVEFLKIGMTVLLMVVVIKLYHALVWLPFLLGLVVVLKSYLITLFWLK